MLELGLEDNRTYQYPKTFTAAPSRPAIAVNENKEIEGVILNQSLINIQNDQVIVTPEPLKPKDKGQRTNDQSPQIDLKSLPVFPVETSAISLKLQNVLTDYDFKVENIQIETRIEKSQQTGYTAVLPRVNFEVLDWKNMRITLQLTEQVQKLLGGRRLQFRIHDKERGDSDWYAIRQTFVRVPTIVSVKCTNEMNGMCELKGIGIDYISQVSIDGGKSWYPNNQTTLQAQPTPDGQTAAMIPLYTDNKMLMLKLRDFSSVGLLVKEYTFSNTFKLVKNAQMTTQNQAINQTTSKPTQGGLKQPAPTSNPNQTPAANIQPPILPNNPKLRRRKIVKL